MYVYKNAARTNLLFAKNAKNQDKGVRFYCPNPKCDAHMYISNIDGVSASYFRATRSHKHTEGCPYGISNGFDPNKYNEKSFEFDNALMSLMSPSPPQSKSISPREHGNGIVIPKPPRTIRQIYSMCKSHEYSDRYNGQTIGKMLLDNRSIHMYPKGVFGWKIIEAKCKRPNFYDSDKMEISLVVAFIEKNDYTFVLKFDDEKLFKEIKNIIFSNKNYLIIVAGQWYSTGTYNVFQTTFSSKKQLSIIK